MKMKNISMGVVSLLLLSACSDHLEEEQGFAPAVQELRLAASFDNTSTRLGLNDVDSKVEVTWEADDVLQVYAPGSATTFQLESGAGTQKAIFVGTPSAPYAIGDPLCAVYGDASLMTPDADGNLTLSLAGQDGRLTDRYQYLYGSTTYSGEGTAFQFKHLASLIKARLKLHGAAESLSHIQVEGAGIFEKVTLMTTQVPASWQSASSDLQLGDLVYSKQKSSDGTYGEVSPNGKISLEGPFMADADGVVTVYLYVLPARVMEESNNRCYSYSTAPTITATDSEGNQYVAATYTRGKVLEPARMYNLSIDLFRLVDFENEADATAGGSDNPYIIRNAEQFFSLMKRADMHLTNSQGRPYRNCSYRLEENIDMGQIRGDWMPISLSNMTFDGNGHQIYGSFRLLMQNNTGLFGSLQNSVVKNLTLDIHPIFFSANYYQQSFGTLAGEAYHSTIEYCFNRSSVSVPMVNIGGLVGVLRYSQVVGCGNEGAISRSQGGTSFENLGGIAGKCEDNSMISGCYNTGNLTVDLSRSSSFSVGGIAGSVNSSINACWSAHSFLFNQSPVSEATGEMDGSVYYNGGIAGTVNSNSLVAKCYWNNRFLSAAIGRDNGSTVTPYDLWSYGIEPESLIPNQEIVDYLNGYLENTIYRFTTDGKPLIQKVEATDSAASE